MPKLGVFSGAELCRLLKQNGFDEVRQRGSHVVMQKYEGLTTVTVPVPMHREIRGRNTPVHHPTERFASQPV